jgi:hypothetical protein
MGLSFVALAVGLLGMGWTRAGLFLVGLAPAVHTALGSWLLGLVGLTAMAGGRELRSMLLPRWKPLAAGLAAAAVSFVAHRALVPSAPDIDPVLAERYLRAFVGFWDAHRFPIDLGDDSVRLSAGVTALAAVWLVWFAGAMTPAARLLLRLTAAGGVLSLALAVWSSLSGDALPAALVVFMPARLLNLNVLLAGALVLGLLGATADRRAGQMLVALAAAALVVSNRSLLWELLGIRWWRLDALSVLSFAAAGLVAVAAWARAPGLPRLRWIVALPLVAAAGLVAAHTARGLPLRVDRFRDRTNDPLFAAASRGTGPLLTGGELFLIQLRTRRPVLLDGGTLDTLPYALESGPAMDAILRDVYGIDLFNPPAEARGIGRVPEHTNRIVWAGYSRDHWREIGHRYGVTQVVTPEGWAIDLDVVVRSAGLVLYEIR